MKTLRINIDDSVYDKFITFIKSLPKEKVNVFDEIDDSHIPFIDIEEQKEIMEIVKDSDAKIMSKSKTINL